MGVLLANGSIVPALKFCVLLVLLEVVAELADIGLKWNRVNGNTQHGATQKIQDCELLLWIENR